MYKLCFYVTEDHLEPVKQALFAVGAGSYDEFVNCAWQSKGEGQYQIKDKALVKITEYKVEMYCADKYLNKAINALLKSHPCDKPAYDIVAVNNSFK